MIHLYFHGGSRNHGCETIVRSTLVMGYSSKSLGFARDLLSAHDHLAANTEPLTEREVKR